MILYRFVLLLLLFTLFVAKADDAAAEDNFKIFDATLYKSADNVRDYGIPFASEYGIEPIEVMYAGDIWPGNKDSMHSPPSKEVLKKSVNRVRKKFMPFDMKVVCLDIEHWSLKENGQKLEVNKSKYIHTIQAYKEMMPGIKFGYYSMLPVRSYYDALAGEGSDKYKKWGEKNDKLIEVSQYVDIVFPSLYTFSSTKNDWVKYAIENIKQARKYGKPVYVFIWPQYHNSVKFIGLDYIPAEFWKLQLETAKKYADGVVIWGGWDHINNRQLLWDDEADWWSILKNFSQGSNS